METRINKNLVFTLIVLMWLVCVANFIVFRNRTLEQIVLICSAIFSSFAVVSVLSRQSEVKIATHFIVLLLPLISTLANGSGFGSMLNMINLFNIILLAKEFPLSKKHYDWLGIITYLTTLGLLLLFFKKDGIMYDNIINGTEQNPNGYASICLINAIIACSLISRLSNTKLKISLNFIYAVIMLIVIYNTKARTSFIALILYYLICLVFAKKRSFKRPEWLVIGFLVCCMIVTIAYTIIYHFVGDEFLIFGKKLYSGRQLIWTEIFKMLETDWLFGFSNSIKLVEWYNTHNAYLAIWGNLGILTFVAFLIYLFYSQKTSYGKNCYDRYMYFGIFAVLFLSTFEVFLLDGNYYFLVLPLLINKVEVKSGDKQNYSLLLVWECQKTKNCRRLRRVVA